MILCILHMSIYLKVQLWNRKASSLQFVLQHRSASVMMMMAKVPPVHVV